MAGSETAALDRAMSNAIDAIRPRLERAVRRGFYGTVHLAMTFQDGVLQHTKGGDEEVKKAAT